MEGAIYPLSYLCSQFQPFWDLPFGLLEEGGCISSSLGLPFLFLQRFPLFPVATWPVVDQPSSQQQDHLASVSRGRGGAREGHWQVKERGC